MELGLGDDIGRLHAAGRNFSTHLVNLSLAHAALFELELKNQLRLLVIAACLLLCSVVVGAIGLSVASFALAGAINHWLPVVGPTTALAIVALCEFALMAVLVAFTRSRFSRVSLSNLESVKSCKESVLCVLQKV